MALRLGELVAYIKADDTHLDKGIKSAEGKMRQLGGKARQFSPVIGAAMAAGIGAGLVGGLDLDAARAKLTAQVGDPALAKQLGDAAGKAYGRGFGETAADSMLAARSLMQAGLLPKGADAAVIEDLTVKAQSLATVFDQDVTQTARAAAQMVKTGLAGNATEAFDILTRGFQTSGDQADDLLDTFSEYSTKFRDIGLSGQQAMGLMSQGLQAGARDADTVADALKEFSIRAIDGSKTTADGFAALGLSGAKMQADIAAGGPKAAAALDLTLDRLRNIKDPAERNAAAVALFGTKAEDLGDALFALDPSEATKALGEVGGAAGKMGDKLEDTASQKLEKFKRQAQQALVEKLGQALPTLEKVGNWASENSGTLLTISGVIAGIAVSVWAVNAAMAVWNTITTIATAVQWLLNIAMLANPIGLIVLAIVALVGGIYLLWTHSSAFRDFWIMVWDAIWGAIKAVGQWFKDTLWPWMKDVWNKISGAAGKAKDWIVGKWDAMIGFFKGLPGKLRKAASGMWDGIKNSFKSALNWIIRKWNDLSFRIPGLSIPGVGQVFGGATLSTPNIPMLAKGGHITGAGAALVGERGPELLHMPRGATVQPLSGGGGSVNVNHHITVAWPDGKKLAELIIDGASRRGTAPARMLGVVGYDGRLRTGGSLG